VKRLLLLITMLAVALPGTASASTSPCRNKIFNDWYPDGKIASTYPVSCYRDALKHMPPDAAVYSSLGADVRAAMRAAIRRANGLSAPVQVGHGSKAIGAGNVEAALTSTKKPQDPTSGVATTASGSPVAATGGSGTPLPILVLGGIAIALVAAGAIGAGVRHARGRNR
jgi:hypothetical protein